jgi:hypothetical protein
MTCLRAPAGWFCTRRAGHAGSCAAVKTAPAPLREVNMSRTCPPAIATTDPRLLTCCLAIDPGGLGAVCHDTKGHDGPHEWDRLTPMDDTGRGGAWPKETS